MRIILYAIFGKDHQNDKLGKKLEYIISTRCTIRIGTSETDETERGVQRNARITPSIGCAHFMFGIVL